MQRDFPAHGLRPCSAEGCPFKGCLYFGLMLTPDGPKVIEYNCRFGDPETQVVLPLLESDLLTVMRGRQRAARWTRPMSNSATARRLVSCLASGGYPLDTTRSGKEITGLTAGQLDAADVTVYHAGTSASRTAGSSRAAGACWA